MINFYRNLSFEKYKKKKKLWDVLEISALVEYKEILEIFISW